MTQGLCRHRISNLSCSQMCRILWVIQISFWSIVPQHIHSGACSEDNPFEYQIVRDSFIQDLHCLPFKVSIFSLCSVAVVNVLQHPNQFPLCKVWPWPLECFPFNSHQHQFYRIPWYCRQICPWSPALMLMHFAQLEHHTTWLTSLAHCPQVMTMWDYPQIWHQSPEVSEHDSTWSTELGGTV